MANNDYHMCIATMAKEKEVKNMTATNKLKAKMVEVGITQAELAKILGISYQAMNYKINNRSEFKVSEIEAVADTLKIVNKDEYFFA